MSRIKILVVDDETTLTRMLKLNLENTGQFEVRTENKGSRTLTAAHEFKPDLILLDIMMPDMMGSEVAEKLLEDKKLKDIRIIFLTALISKHETETSDGRIAGRAFIAKPVSIEELIEFIEEELGISNNS
jgi:DNA-binding response OmpR family regulator